MGKRTCGGGLGVAVGRAVGRGFAAKADGALLNDETSKSVATVDSDRATMSVMRDECDGQDMARWAAHCS